MDTKISAEGVNVFYGEAHALKNVSMQFMRNEVTALIGPSGCGKSTFLRCLNRMNDVIPDCKVEGKIMMGDVDINDSRLDVVRLREKVGMVFQKPNPFPKSIYDNVAYGPSIHGLARTQADMDRIVEESLQKAGLLEEVKDRLNQPGTGLSGGQQQRLCIARAIAVSPDVILMDEPCSALDPIATARIEELIEELRKNYTIIIACRASLKAVPPSIREGALAMGASKMQTILHHVLPLAMPGTLTGTIIGLAQALGETAPLLMIGMFAFVVDIPAGPLESATALPVQVYLWAESSERGYVELTAAGIMMILIFMALMNSFAIILRKKFERRW